ncbi:MAG TPA: insulinase family protein [Bacteroidales bacterium]|jgi:zinc protease|nr:insulinase family protein [Bacteroidales bacterium]
MKNRFSLNARQIIVFLTCLLIAVPFLMGQDRLEQPIPVDEKIKIGKLDNGFTYYIRKNLKPEKRMELRLVVKAGSVLEDEDQRGLAHFVEHMAFNGTKNFEKNELIHYMQSVGVQFGPEVNAGTSFNETIYMLTLPTDSAHIIDKGFQVMEDWAHSITFDGTEIDKERGIIVEEWRLNQGLNQRLQDKLFPVLFEGSQYAVRNPIGKKEIIEGAPHATLKRFYSDWYRPELMALIVVGDIDPETMEKKILEHFSSVKNPESTRERKGFPIPDHEGTKLLIFADKEMPVVQLALFCKLDPEKEVLQKDYRRILIYQLISGMLTQRLNELREKPDPPIMGSQVSYGELVPEKSVFQLVAMVPENGIDRGIQTLITEAERAVRFGFTEGEVKRQKTEILTSFENAYNERDKTNSASYASEYSRNFLQNEPIPGIEFEYNFVKEYLDGITLEEINDLLRKSLIHDNRVLAILAPEKEGLQLPDDASVQKSIETATSVEITAYEDKLSGSQLLSDQPKKGRVLLTKKNDKLGTVELKLSNGSRVVLKQTDFKNDQVLFSSYSPGGYSVYSTEDHQSAVNADDIIPECGVDGYSLSDLTKLLAGKNISASPYISEYFEGITGSSVPKDLETMFQLVYLYFTKPRKDTVMFNSIVSLQKSYLKNALSDPETYFSDWFTRAKTQDHPRADVIPTVEEFSKINIDRLYEIYNDRFADASDFTFFIVGSFNQDSIKPLIEKYLASLPATKRGENWKDMGIRPPSKKTDLPVYKGSDPKSLIGLYFEIPQTWDPEQDHAFESLGQLLDIRYNDIIREELSGAYTINASADMGMIPYSRAIINVIIPCSPENTDKLTKVAIAELQNIQKNGVSPEDLVKVKEAQRRGLEKNLKENGYWISQLLTGYRYNDPEMMLKYAEWTNSLTSEKIQEAARRIDLKKYVRVVLHPEKTKP